MLTSSSTSPADRPNLHALNPTPSLPAFSAPFPLPHSPRTASGRVPTLPAKPCACPKLAAAAVPVPAEGVPAKPNSSVADDPGWPAEFTIITVVVAAVVVVAVVVRVDILFLSVLGLLMLLVLLILPILPVLSMCALLLDCGSSLSVDGD